MSRFPLLQFCNSKAESGTFSTEQQTPVTVTYEYNSLLAKLFTFLLSTVCDKYPKDSSNKRPRGHFAHLRIKKVCAKFEWNWANGSGEELHYCIFSISLLSPLKKGQGPSFEKTWIQITQECFVPSLVEIGPGQRVSGSGEEDKYMKSLLQHWQQLQRTGQIVIRKLTWTFGSGELYTWYKENFSSPNPYLNYSVGLDFYTLNCIITMLYVFLCY